MGVLRSRAKLDGLIYDREGRARAGNEDKWAKGRSDHTIRAYTL